MTGSIAQAIGKHRVIAILRGIPPSLVEEAVRALYRGGIRLVEVTFDQSSPARLEDTARSIQNALRQRGELMVGAGTVLTAREVHTAADAGASFVLSPNTNPEVIQAAAERGIGAVPGAMTPTEVEFAYRCGASAVKLFPCENLGPAYIRAIRAPLSHIPLLAVGGVRLDNVRDFLEAGAAGVGIGSHIVSRERVEAGEFDAIASLAAQFSAAAQRGASEEEDRK